MQTITVNRKYRASIAHYLNHYSGKCANLHGHNYEFEFMVGAMTEQDKEELYLGLTRIFIDFGGLKEFALEYVEPWDHALLAPLSQKQVDEMFKTDLVLLKMCGLKDVAKVIAFGENPTAEAMAMQLANHLLAFVRFRKGMPELLKDMSEVNIIVGVRVTETADCSAYYELMEQWR